MSWCVYLLKSNSHNRTYVGSTVDLERRLNQHNQVLKGGAKFTKGSKWNLVYSVNGFKNRSEAFRCEADIKNESGLDKRLVRLMEWRRNAAKNGFLNESTGVEL